jgi:hypothetical protein
MKQSNRKLTWLPPVLAVLSSLLLVWYLRWRRTFVAVEVEDVMVPDRQGTPRQGKRVRVQSIFDLAPQEVWQKVTTPALLVSVTHPVMTFRPVDGGPLPEDWQVGDSVDLKLYGLGFIPLGRHTISLERLDAGRREIQSRERGQLAETWLHLIRAEPYGDGQTLYTDEIDIYAGSFTGIITAFAVGFYCYRQTRWRRVIKAMQAA